MTKKEQVLLIQKVFDDIYADADCTLEYTNALHLLIATQLAAQCTDARVNTVTPALFERYPTVEAFAEADIAELEEYIKPTGFYHNKAKNIIACCKRLRDAYDSIVPDTMEDLTSLAGVGRKTANLVLGDIFGKPGIVVDTHATRLANRIGLTKQSSPVKIEFELADIVPKEYQTRFCHQLVMHGRAVCNARKPKCDICPISVYCKKAGVEKNKK